MGLRELMYTVQKTLVASFQVIACWDVLMHDFINMFLSMALMLVHGLVLKIVFGEGE